MSDILKIFLTSSFTIIGGIVIYTSGQIISRFIIDPIHEQKRIIGEIADALIYYANVYNTPGMWSDEKMDLVREKFRQLATLLQSKTHLVPFYCFFVKYKMVTNAKAIYKSSENLILLSNSVHNPPNVIAGNTGQQNNQVAEEIKKLLNLKIL